MKRSHNYSSSDSELDDNVDVEKDSGDENRCVPHVTQQMHAFINAVPLNCVLYPLSSIACFCSAVHLIPTARCHPPPPPKFKPESGAEAYVN